MSISHEDLRVVQGSYNAAGRFWYSVEIRTDKRIIKRSALKRPTIEIPWWKPYIINKKNKTTEYFLKSIKPYDEAGIKDFGYKALNRLNNLVDGDQIVDQKTYNDYYEQLRVEQSGPKYTYL